MAISAWAPGVVVGVCVTLSELDGLALVRRLVEAGRHALHHRAGAHLHAGEAGQRLGVEQHAAGED